MKIRDTRKIWEVWKNMASYNYPPKYLVSCISAYLFLTYSEKQVDTIRFGGNYLADIYYLPDYQEVEVELYQGRRKIGLKRWWLDEIQRWFD